MVSVYFIMRLPLGRGIKRAGLLWSEVEVPVLLIGASSICQSTCWILCYHTINDSKGSVM